MDDTVQPTQPEGMLQQSQDKPQSPQNPPKKLNWKGFFIGIIVVIIVEIFAINALKSENKQATSVHPTTVPTKVQSIPTQATGNWKTYIHESYSFKYPSDWQTTTSPDGSTDAQLIYTSNGKKYSLKIASGGSEVPKVDKIQDSLLTVDGKKFVKKVWIKGDNIILISLIPNENTSFNHIEMSIPPDENEKYIQIFDRIVSTIKFTNSFNITPPISCRPRPACLDATPRCMIAETSDMCPKTSVTATPPPGCHYSACNISCTADNPNCCQQIKRLLICPK